MITPTLEEISATLQNHAVFAVIAETLDAWQPPSTPEGRRVMLRGRRHAPGEIG